MIRSLRFLPLAMVVFWFAATPACSSRSSKSGGPETTAQADGELGTIICGSTPTGVDRTSPASAPEYYIVHSMNQRLRYFPDFAEAIGMHSVRTCDEARRFRAAYQTYFTAHPYFDKKMPLERPGPPPPIPANARSEVFVPKVYMGNPFGQTGTDLVPIVHIAAFLPAGATYFNGDPVPGAGDESSGVVSCSGTFIAKNFILTAAHCIAKVALQYDPSSLQAQTWTTAAQWQIDFPDPNGKIRYQDTSTDTDESDIVGGGDGGDVGQGSLSMRTWAVSYVNPLYSNIVVNIANAANGGPFYFPPGDGSVPNPFETPYDLALLFIPPTQNDGNLPANVDTTFAVQIDQFETDLNLDPATSHWNLIVAGYGPTDASGTNRLVLNRNVVQPPINEDPNQLTAPQTTGSGQFGLCHGDSGGPMYREFIEPSGLVDHVIVAVNSGSSGGSTTAGECVDKTGESSFWARVDVAKDWLTERVQSALNGADWTPPEVIDGISFTGNAFMKLHGPACVNDCSCPIDQTCFNSINDPSSPFSPQQGLNSCQACPVIGGAIGAIVGTCWCIKGQCIPPPDIDDDAGPNPFPNSCFH